MVDRSTAFVMHGTRAAIADGMPHIEEQVKAIEQNVGENPGLAFDIAKTLIESAIKTILRERDIAFDNDWDLPKLFKTISNNLPFLPPQARDESEARKSLLKTLNGLHTAVQGVCELRNTCGFASHGADSARPRMEMVQALLAAQAADTIVGFFHRVNRQDHISKSTQLQYEDNSDFNEHIDGLHASLQIFELEFKASEILFQMDPEAYRVYLAEFSIKKDGEENTLDDSERTGERT